MYTVYKIENIKTKMIYVGSTNNFRVRKSEHLSQLRKGTHPNRKLQRAFTEFKEENFEFSIITENLSSREDMLLREYEVILKTWDINYNVNKTCPVVSNKQSGFSYRKNKVGQMIIQKEGYKIGKERRNLRNERKKKSPALQRMLTFDRRATRLGIKLKGNTPDDALERKRIREARINGNKFNEIADDLCAKEIN